MTSNGWVIIVAIAPADAADMLCNAVACVCEVEGKTRAEHAEMS